MAVKKINEKKEKKSSKSSTESKKIESKKEPKKISAQKSGDNSQKEMSKKSAKKTTVSKKNASKKVNATKKISSRAKRSIKSTAKSMLAEYYDLPYRYNETVVRILAQTPTTLFVYWDISDEDRNSLMKLHGDNVFHDTKPILIVHNTTKNYSFEVEINDFANSWYIRTQEPDCNYIIELGRKPINNPSEYIHIQSSNNIVSPNNRVLFEKENLGSVQFRNVKTNVISYKDFGSLRFINNMDKLYGNIYDVYSKLYNKEILNELTIPSSGEFIKK